MSSRARSSSFILVRPLAVGRSSLLSQTSLARNSFPRSFVELASADLPPNVGSPFSGVSVVQVRLTCPFLTTGVASHRQPDQHALPSPAVGNACPLSLVPRRLATRQQPQPFLPIVRYVLPEAIIPCHTRAARCHPTPVRPTAFHLRPLALSPAFPRLS